MRRPTDRASRSRRGLRRLFGLDRSGPPPQRTRRGEPLRPLTLPNLVGYARLGAIPVFLVLAFGSPDGRTTAAAGTYWAIAASDYLDGFLARATGQYSRMGAILDPVVDRLTVLAGIVVCWHFDLLPQWGLALLAAREVATMALAELALRRGFDLEINWLGRIAVWLTMGGVFLALVTAHWLAPAVFFCGLAIAIYSTVLYVRAGVRAGGFSAASTST